MSTATRKISVLSVLLLAGLFALFGCRQKPEGSEYLLHIIDNYDLYENELSEYGLSLSIEDAASQPGDFLNPTGKVIVVTSPIGDRYVFYTMSKSNTHYDKFSGYAGDICQIYLSKDADDSHSVSYKLSILLEFRSDYAYSEVSYENEDRSNFGSGVITYYSGNFSPDDSELTMKQKRTDGWIKAWVSAEELSNHYEHAYEYYKILCSMIDADQECIG